MTEDQAKQKWCPFVRQAEHGGGSWNRASWPDGDILNLDHSKGLYACNCIASLCMAWRFQYISKDSGYCGLAGEP